MFHNECQGSTQRKHQSLDIIKTSGVVRNDMTNQQQSHLTKRVVEKRKQKEIKLPEYGGPLLSL